LRARGRLRYVANTARGIRNGPKRKGLPPTLIHIGTCETLLDDSTRFAAAAGAANVAVTLEICPDMIHAWPMWNAHLEPGRRALANAGEFIRRHL
jgi:epsilon-lactone hydrolase